jgi:hypothetical protein
VLPDLPFRNNFVVGSSHGWLVTADELSWLLLLNLMTRAQLPLPPPLTITNVRGCYTSQGVLERYDLLELDLANRDCDLQAEPADLTLEEARFYFYLRVAISSDPSNGSCIVMILHMPQNHLSFARVGDTHWTWLDVDGRCCRYHHIIYDDQDGLFYAIRGNGEVTEYRSLSRRPRQISAAAAASPPFSRRAAPSAPPGPALCGRHAPARPTASPERSGSTCCPRCRPRWRGAAPPSSSSSLVSGRPLCLDRSLAWVE